MNSAKKYPYQNLTLDDLPGEEWRPIEGFEQRYEISSLGRVKTLPRERILHHGGIQRFGEKIRRLKADVKRNKHVQDSLYSFNITLKQDGKVRNFSIGRLVYNAFVEAIELKDRSFLIGHKDGDGRNMHYQNLFKTTISEIKLHSFEIGRSLSHLSVLSKPISQFTTDGKLIKQYESMYQAGKENGFNGQAISSVANGKKLLCKGYVWQFGKAKKLRAGALPSKAEKEKINKGLMSRLGMKRLREPILAIFDLSLQSRTGERWKDIPGYEGLYEISNLGRIKALKKVSEGSRQQWYPTIIKCISVEISVDDHKKPRPGSAFVTLSKNGKKKTIYIARWVYNLFVKPFEISNTLLRVYYKDNNNLNLSAGNLELHDAVWSINKL